MESNKVKLPKEVAEQLDWINQHNDYPIRVVVELFNGQVNGNLPVLTEFFESDRSRRITLITQALVNGYEVEQTPEDEVRDIYNRYLSPYNGIGASAIRDCLDALNINIKGVNDHE